MSRQASKRRRHQQHSCAHKRRYGSELGALQAATARTMSFYRCPGCRGWHLTKMPMP